MTDLTFQNQINWLLTGEPAIRYQVFKDLVPVTPVIIESERQKISQTGWGRRLLDLQQPSGLWSDAIYSPKWTSTFYTLLTLKILGICPEVQIVKACKIILDKGFYKDGGINFWKSYKNGETCVTGMFLSVLAHFNIGDERMVQMARHLIRQQMADGGWNCESYKGATHSSFHTTLSVLEGLWEYQKSSDSTLLEELKIAQKQGVEFLLKHRLFKSHQTGQVVDYKMTRLIFPSYWRYDIVRCLEYCCNSNQPKDPRMEDAISLLQSKQTREGFWNMEYKHPAKVFFDFEKIGQPSYWNTFRMIKILRWWYGQ